MIRFQPAGAEHFDELLEIVYYHDDSYLKPLLDLVQLSWDQFGLYFRTTGRVYRILVGDHLAGLCWVEVRGRVLRLHGLIVRDSFQGQGLGTKALLWLEEAFGAKVDEIELQVHASNPRAKALYERLGYRAVAHEDPAGFYTMRKEVREPEPVPGGVNYS